jgi:hypothetical protein
MNGRDAAAAGVLGGHLGPQLETTPAAGSEAFANDLIARADAVAANRLKLFDLDECSLGEEVRWNFEHKAQRSTPMGFADAIDYRDYNLTGDCKFVWELNRHHQFVVLGRAYRVTGDLTYARAAARLLESWLDQCPFGMGMNWRSPLELGIRIINWVWFLELIRPSGVITEELGGRLLQAAYRHLFEISRKYSRFSSANNHLIGEAAGVFIGSSYFSHLKGAGRWRAQSHAILETEILRQTYSDGGTREQAIGYHLFVLQFFLFCGLAARNTGWRFGGDYWHRMEKMFEFIALLREGGSSLPMFGDCDDGYVLDLGGGEDIVRSYLTVGAILFDRADFKAQAGGFSEPAFWLFGGEGRRCFDRIGADEVPAAIGPHALPESGYYVLQRGHRDQPDRISVVFDCGDLGFGSIAAHGHADALSLTLRAFGVDVLVDPGTYDYFMYGPWRSYFRSTRAHNTIVIDDQDQSQMLGPFLWGRRARARCVEWQPSPQGGEVLGEHDGYTGLDDPVIHRRRVMLDARESVIVVEDEIAAAGRHVVELNWHLAEHCEAEARGSHEFIVDCGPGVVTVVLDPRMAVSAVRGSEEPIRGWVSRGYHRKTPSTTLTGRCESEGTVTFRTRVLIGS